MERVDPFLNHSTGSISKDVAYKRVPFGQYEVTVALDENGGFVDITEIALKKGFLSIEQKQKVIGYHDVTDFYQS